MATEQTFKIGGDMEVHRMGFGAMRITGEGIWGWPEDIPGARRLLERVRELGITLIDTADAYGPETSEYLIEQTLAPYPDDMVIATKGGLVRAGPSEWVTDGRPGHLRRACLNSARRLGIEQIPLYQFHAPDDDVPFMDSIEALAQLKESGRIRHLGLSNVTVDQIEQARQAVEIATVQNRYNLTDRKYEDVVDYCTEHGIGFIPWYPLATGDLTEDDNPVAELAGQKGAEPGQIALAWLMHRSPVMLPIPGTSSIEHLEENWAARTLELTDEEFDELDGLADDAGDD